MKLANHSRSPELQQTVSFDLNKLARIATFFAAIGWGLGISLPAIGAETISIDGTAFNTNGNFPRKDGYPIMYTYPLNTNDADQQFDRLPGKGSKLVLLKHKSTGLCLNAHDWKPGGIVNLYPCNVQDNDQNWDLNTNGSIYLVKLGAATSPDMCLDMPNRKSSTQITLYYCNGNSNQRLTFTTVNSPQPSGNISQPDFSKAVYRSSNPLWSTGFAPASTNPPSPKLGQSKGNCTWYSLGRGKEIGNNNAAQLNKLTGNAYEWGTLARNAGIATSTTPKVGAIAHWDISNAYPGGHVAIVEQVNANGTIVISESSYVTALNSAWDFLWRTRTISANNPSRYILP